MISGSCRIESMITATSGLSLLDPLQSVESVRSRGRRDRAGPGLDRRHGARGRASSPLLALLTSNPRRTRWAWPEPAQADVVIYDQDPELLRLEPFHSSVSASTRKYSPPHTGKSAIYYENPDTHFEVALKRVSAAKTCVCQTQSRTRLQIRTECWGDCNAAGAANEQLLKKFLLRRFA